MPSSARLGHFHRYQKRMMAYSTFHDRVLESRWTLPQPKPNTLLKSNRACRRMITRGIGSQGLSWTSDAVVVDVDILVEGCTCADEFVETLRRDAISVVRHAVYYASNARMEDGETVTFPRPVEVSLVLCDDGHIRNLNKEWRNMDKATDVLAFEMNGSDDSFEFSTPSDLVDAYVGEEEQACELEQQQDDDDEEEEAYAGDEPVVMLGDVVISIDTAQRQAEERGHSLLDECRVLLIHGVLHLLGYDHEYSEEDAEEMHQAEVSILKQSGFKGDSGLIGFGDVEKENTQVSNTSATRSHDVRLLCLDMDGTLLNSSSEVLPSSVDALRMARDRGVRVILATGKARPAAMKALENVGLAGDEYNIVGVKTPGIFLQGLQVYGMNGCVLGGGTLDMSIARNILSYAVENDVSITCFLGDECVSPKITKELEELHYRYYEPYPQVLSIDDIVQGPSIRKMLLMHDPDSIKILRAYMDDQLESTNAGTMQAVETMLEIVPRGFNKWTALQLLISHLDGIHADQVMAIGDGENDLEMIQGAGIGVAMGNAVPPVKNAADVVVSTNDDGGIYEAIERFVLNS